MLDFFYMALGVALLFFGVVIIATRRVTPPPGYRADIIGLSRCLGGYFIAMGAVLLCGTLGVLFVPDWPALLGTLHPIVAVALLIVMVFHSGRFIHKE